MNSKEKYRIEARSGRLFVMGIIALLCIVDTTAAMQEYEKLNVLVAETERGINNLESDNNAVGTGAREQMQDIRQAAQDVRNRVLELRSLASAGNQAGQGQSPASPMGWLVPPGNGELSLWKWLAGVRTISLGRMVELNLRTEGEGQMGSGTAVLSFLEFTGSTEVSVACWDLAPTEEHIVCAYDAAQKSVQDIAKFITTDQGVGYTRVRLDGDASGLELVVVPVTNDPFSLITVERKCYSLGFLALVSETDEQEDHVTRFQTQGQMWSGSLE